MNSVEFYNQHAAEFYRETVDMRLDARYEPFLDRIPATGVILDAGCGSGRDSRAFLNRGYRVTAFDASPEMARLAGALTGLPVATLRFQEMAYIEEFDGIWSCASLLHVPQAEMVPVFNRFEAALKPGGHWYASFKYGVGETVKYGSGEITSGVRMFTNYTEDTFREVIAPFAALEIVDLSITDDLRSERRGERWLNVILRKRPAS